MRRKKLVRMLFAANFAIAVMAVAVVSVVAFFAFGEVYFDLAEKDLEARARMLSKEIEDLGIISSVSELAGLVKSVDECGGTRATVIARDGTVLADSRRPAWLMENHSDRPEFQAALRGAVATARRRSPTLGSVMVYAAAPVRMGSVIVGVARISVQANVIDAASSLVVTRIGLAAGLVLLLAAVASLVLSRRIIRPLERIRDAASQFAQANFSAKAPASDVEEFASLSQSLNWMASEISRQMQALSDQASERNAIMQSMKEGVLAVGADDVILLLNPAAEQLLGIAPGQPGGKPLQEVVRNPALQRLIEETSKSGVSMASEFVVRTGEERVIQATAAPLIDSSGSNRGIVVVLYDITQTRKLENMRRDFVANVSHELKTPITAIKGFVEALKEGAINDRAKADEFLAIIARQTHRLNAIVEDLLSLARIEQSAEAKEIELKVSDICPVLEAARADCEPKAADAGVKIEVDCPSGLSARINAPLLEQAVTNLLDNAIKYSRRGGTVTVQAEARGNEVSVSVIDKGQGISAEHIPRIFERFYRVDKARSRKEGGTGLGLAIVKHIVQAHGGQVEVVSEPGKGSTFTILLPAG